MKVFRLPQLAELNPEKKVILGKEELGTENAGLKYQSLLPKERACVEKSSKGREEIIYVVKGSLQVEVKKSSFPVNAGEAFYSEKEMTLENRSDTEAAFLAASAPASTPVYANGKTVSPAPEPGKTDNGPTEKSPNTDPNPV